MIDEQKEVALVTGASRGIGKAIAIALAETGRHIIVNYRHRQDAAEETLRAVEAAGATGELAQFDVADATATESAVDALLARHERIDVLINNAGIHKDNLLVWMESEDWHSVLEVDLSGFYHVTRSIAKRMILNRHGRIVNIASVSGQIGTAGQVNYSAAKAGLIGATKALAREIAKRNITVNAVAPGFIDTEMLDELPRDELVKLVPMKRLGTATEVAALVAFLCSRQAAYITGQVIGINGGIC